VADRYKIEWTDATWNPVRGCTKVVLIAKHGLADRIWQSVIRREGSGQKRLW
jgi:protein gp37